MNHWLHELRRELRAQRLPRTYIRQFMDEVADHLDDLITEGDSAMEGQLTGHALATQRLGSPAKVAAAAKRDYAFPTVAGRHPWLSFVLRPMLLMWLVVGVYAALFIATVVGLSAVPALAGLSSPTLILIGATAFSMGFYSIGIVPIGMTTWWMCRSWRRSGRSAKWMLAAIVLLALSSSLIQMDLTANQLHLGISSDSLSSAALSLQFWLPPLLACWFLRELLPAARRSVAPH